MTIPGQAEQKVDGGLLLLAMRKRTQTWNYVFVKNFTQFPACATWLFGCTIDANLPIGWRVYPGIVNLNPK
jgi:hypothetical protein